MKRRLTAMFLSICLVFSPIPVSAQASLKPNIQIGDYVKWAHITENRFCSDVLILTITVY